MFCLVFLVLMFSILSSISKLDDSMVAKELTISDSEHSDAEVSYTENGMFNLSRGQTPLTEGSEGERKQLLEGVECQGGTSVMGWREDMLPPTIEVWLFAISLAAGNELQLPVLFRTEASSFIPVVLEWSKSSSSAKADPALSVWLCVLVLPSSRWLLQHQHSLQVSWEVKGICTAGMGGGRCLRQWGL